MGQFNKTSFVFHFLLLVYIFLYFMFNNLAEYSLQCYFNSLLIIAAYFIISLMAYFFLPKKCALYAYCFLLGFAFYALLISTYFQEGDLLINGSIAVLICYVIISLFLAVSYFALDKIALTLIVIMSVLNITKGIMRIEHPYLQEQIQNSPVFVTKPNVYLFIMESYQGQEALKKLHDFDNQQFYDFLKQHLFKTYNNFYSLYPTTRASVLSMFTHNQKVNVSGDDTSNIFLQKEPSYVFDTFKINGYAVNYLFPNQYLVHTQKHLFTGFLPKTKSKKKYNVDTDYLNDVMLKLDNLAEAKAPFISVIKIGGITENQITYTGGVAHLQNIFRKSGEIEKLPELKKSYIKEMLRQNKFMEDIIEKVIKNDPNGIIILLGDHGPFFYDIWKITASYKAHNVSKEDYILDRYNVLCAIRWPNNINSSQNIHFVPEVFELVLAELSQNKLETEKVDTLYDFSNVKHDISDWELDK